MITGIIVAAVVVGCVGIILGFFLGIAGEKFKVETDPREDAILEFSREITVVAVDMPDVPDLLRQSQRERHRSISVRSVESRLPQRLARSWVFLPGLR